MWQKNEKKKSDFKNHGTRSLINMCTRQLTKI